MSNKSPTAKAKTVALRRSAEAIARTDPPPAHSLADPQRLLHELHVHQIELEMQNTELIEARNRMEVQLEKYSDLYDFAPVGYFTLNEEGVILEVNLTGATLFGVERSRLLRRRLLSFTAPASREHFSAFLKEVFARPGRQVQEASLLMEDGVTFWADLQAIAAPPVDGQPKWCRMTISDITPLKQAQEVQRRHDALAISNQKLEKEILHRQAVEKELKLSEKHQVRLLAHSEAMQERLRHLSHQTLTGQEAERKRISRELHDIIAQTLVAINLHLATLSKEAALINRPAFIKKLAHTQQLIERSVAIVHDFAGDLRPTSLDDLGLIPALEGHFQDYFSTTGIRVALTADAKVEALDSAGRTVFYRIAQEALTNVARHAQATAVIVRLQCRRGMVRMEIQDDGQGFEPSVPTLNKSRRHLGLLGMKERVEMFGGTFHLQSTPGQPTTVRVDLPLPKAKLARSR